MANSVETLTLAQYDSTDFLLNFEMFMAGLGLSGIGSDVVVLFIHQDAVLQTDRKVSIFHLG